MTIYRSIGLNSFVDQESLKLRSGCGYSAA
jgi:hypothetical protein